MSADLLGDANDMNNDDQRLDPQVAASAFPDIEGVDSAADKFPDIEGTGLDGAAAAVDSNDNAQVAAPPSDEIEQFESSFPALEGEEELNAGGATGTAASSQPPVSINNDFAPPPTATATAPALSQTPSSHISAPLFSARQDTEPEPEAVRSWREKRAEEMAARDAASEKEKDEIKLKAERAIDNFYKDYNSRKEENIKKNKEEEEEFLTKRTDALGKGTTWERICDLLDIDNSQNKQLERKDLKRFKEVLVGLRKQGERAPGAAGY
ncbi:hypothetical protein E3P99_01145 [Wallemia hederae]|uniref:Clathrin light chain n=1 Tax=Wallemia hederae TaxID=1540922 RepID=A0A4T0FT96_9BASI|nr:hypothetical protein E3P99_01145 [Wallemia hederae]